MLPRHAATMCRATACARLSTGVSTRAKSPGQPGEPPAASLEIQAITVGPATSAE